VEFNEVIKQRMVHAFTAEPLAPGTAERLPEFVYTTYIRTTPERLWQGLTDPAFTRQYRGRLAFESDWTAGSATTQGWPRILAGLKSLPETGEALPAG
jgi:hypothetical protein